MKYWKKHFKKQFCRQNQIGFTLMELLVVTAILGILIGISTTVFIGILRSQNKTNVTNEVRQNAVLAIDLFERDVRDAESISESDATNQVTIVKSDETIVWDCYVDLVTNTGQFRRSEDGGVIFGIVTNNDTTSGVDIECIEGDGVKPFYVSGSSKSNIIKLDFTAKEAVNAPTRSDFGINLKFETTVGTRKF